MTTYTATDFADASFARKGDDMLAVRSDPSALCSPWNMSGTWCSDAEMADFGWTPVVAVTEATDPLTQLAAWWDNAEVADRAEKGDVVMHKDDAGFSVWTERFHGFKLDDSYRILRRAPKPKSVKEQIEDMILELDREAGHLSDSEMIAAALTERFDITLKEDEK